MEHSEQFKRLAAFKHELEDQIKICDEVTTSLEKDNNQATNDIEEYFALCLSVLASRKATLLGEVESKFRDKKKNVEKIKSELQNSMESCSQLLKVGTELYNTSKQAAEHIWEGTKHLSRPNVPSIKIKVNLPSDFIKSMQTNGEVLIEENRSSNLNTGGLQKSLLLLGDPGVGKTSIVQRFTDDGFSPNYACTNVMLRKQKAIDIKGKSVTLEIVDAPGSERYKVNAFPGLSRVDGIMLIYDITEYNSFTSIWSWLSELPEFGFPPSVPKILVGNKSDLFRTRKVDFNVAKKFADDHGLRYFETSAKDTNNILNIFLLLANIILA